MTTSLSPMWMHFPVQGYSCVVLFFVLSTFVSLLLMDIFIHVEQRYWMELNKWEHFVNDDCTRSFLSLEATRIGLPEVFTVHVCAILCLHALRVKCLLMPMLY